MADSLLAGPIDVAVIGGGPSGLAAATALKAAGVARVVVLEREPEAGGIPRHCGHPPFGLREFRRVLTGPAYARRLVARALAAGVELRTMVTVLKVLPGGMLVLSTPKGTREITARRVIYATGVRETPRSARLISGARCRGVMNTGALQSMVYLKGRRPFARPVIVGTERVAFSAIMTCRHAGIRPVAMIETGARATARWPSALYPGMQGVALWTDTEPLAINGHEQVESVTVAGPEGGAREIACDGVILSGAFTPEATLGRCGHLQLDPATGGPSVDQWGRCSDPAYFATGNLLRPVETAGACWAEGVQTGAWVAQDLAARLPAPTAGLYLVSQDPRLKYALPQRLCYGEGGMRNIQLRVTEAVAGNLIATTADGPIWRRRLNALPERRIKVPVAGIVKRAKNETVAFMIEAPQN